MKKYLKIILLSAVVLLAGFSLWQAKIQNEKTVQPVSATLKINDGTNSQSFSISGFVGKTALAATEANAKVVASGTGANAFVTSIDSRAADSKKREFWELDANGTETQVGAGSYIIKNGDSILWHINTY